MLLQTVRPNIVQSIRAYRVDDLMQAARHADQHFLYANLTAAQSKQDVLEGDRRGVHCSRRTSARTSTRSSTA